MKVSYKDAFSELCVFGGIEDAYVQTYLLKCRDYEPVQCAVLSKGDSSECLVVVPNTTSIESAQSIVTKLFDDDKAALNDCTIICYGARDKLPYNWHPGEKDLTEAKKEAIEYDAEREAKGSGGTFV